MAHIARAQREQDICVFIGRFQPLHAGHMWVILQALKLAEYLVIVIGSAHAPRRPDLNPFFSSERAVMLRRWLFSVDPNLLFRVKFIEIADSDYDTPEWRERVKIAVNGAAKEISDKQKSISLIGHSKDNTSYYLKMFRPWGSINVPNNQGLSATDFRLGYFSTDQDRVEDMFKRALDFELLSKTTINWLREFQKSDDYQDQVEELEFCLKAKAVFERESYSHSRNTVTGDALIHQYGNVLLIKRDRRPFKGLWALPGGHLETHETVYDCALREGYEETGIKVPPQVFERSLVGQDYFDHPLRDPRGRYITHTFLFNLTPQAPAPDPSKSEAENQRRVRDALALPKVKMGGPVDEEDDAAEAKFWDTGDITRQMMAFDHYAIIRKMLRMLPTEE